MDQHLTMYHVVYGLLYLLSLLPLKILYLFSDLVYVLLYHVAGYRKHVVRSNLALAFPGKTPADRKRIEKKFYRNFIDNFIETLKLLSGGTAFAVKHFKIDNRVMEEQFQKGKRLQFHLGHNFNWELGNVAVSLYTSYQVLSVYLPINNRIFERVMLKLRGASGNKLLPSTQLARAILPYRRQPYLLALIADQVPGDVSKAYWLNFFGKPTPFMRGPERGAVAGNLAVAFGQIYKAKRGHYYLKYELSTDAAGELDKGELTVRYVRFLEKVITDHPEMWLWSHRRWKKEWKPEYRELWIDEKDPVPGTN